MTITIDLPPDLEAAVQRQIAETGKDLGELVVEALQEKIARIQRFDQVCAKFARAVQDSGISELDFETFFEEARNEAWQERQDKAR